MKEYELHNLFRENFSTFLECDPQLSMLKGLLFVHPLDWWRLLDWKKPGIYMLTGGRQVGKTTSTKLLIKHAIEARLIEPRHAYYLPCDQIDDHHHLSQMVRLVFEEIVQEGKIFLLVLDEVTFVREWDRAIKALADEGWFRNGLCIITGSDAIVIREAANRFPGRTGEADQNEFCLRPLDFGEFIGLTAPGLITAKEESAAPLMSRFKDYLQCGGHLRAINDYYKAGEISNATYLVFERWIAGDFEKRGKSLRTLMGVLKQFFETCGTQVTFSALTHRMGEITRDTFMDYASLLERMDILFELQAIDINRRIGASKKARKFFFWDPFLFDCVRRWLERELIVAPMPDRDSTKAESVVAMHFKRRGPAYYFKGKGEIDVLALRGKDIFPVEVKWTNQIRPWDLAELKKFPASVILTKANVSGLMEGVAVKNLPKFLLDQSHAVNHSGAVTTEQV